MTRRVVLVCGPPAAGKTTLVRESASPEDTVVDLDVIAQELGSPGAHEHPPEVLERARRVRSAREALVTRMHTGTAWVVRTAADPQQRDRLAEALGATDVVVVATPAEDARRRAAEAGRPAFTGDVIDRWWRRYRPSSSRLERELAPSQPPEGYPIMPDEPAETEQTDTTVAEATTETKQVTGGSAEDAGDSTEDNGGAPQEGQPAEPFDAKRAQDKIHKANQEAASLRRRLKELEPLAAKAKELEDAQKSDAERLQGKLAEREQEIAKVRARAVKSEVRSLAEEFADKTDPEAHLDLGAYIGEDGDIDTEQIKADLAALLERKPHLGKPKPEAERRRPAPDRTQASGANQPRTKDPAAEFAGFVQTRLLKGR
ncbi:AAA family ATPase [Spirillospora sp. NBC_01491]|uniref:AAA family ATPase n=1 Tax=Spirillospora sp. NBC_01491 TaxID=2976007 RepID=UPI002E35345F|nr:AAA family ATPase [Spirillospora sp. NBC_01491]